MPAVASQSAAADWPAGAAGTPPQTLGGLVLAAARHGPGVAIRFRRAGRPVSVTYSELVEDAMEIARGLIAVGVQRGERVAILCATRPEWTLADCGCLCAGAVVVPVYHTNSPPECAYVLQHSQTSVIICEDAAQVAKIAQVRDRLPRLREIVVIDGTAAGAITLGELRARGGAVGVEAVQERVRAGRAGEPATLVYTSGTTGPPKGCLLSHQNMLFTARAYAARLQLNSSHSLYQFLPLAHVLARICQFVVLDVGGEVTFWGGDPRRIIAELSEAQPTHFPAVPRIYEKIHAAVLGRVDDGPALQRAVFRRALAEGRRLRRWREQGATPPPWRRLRHRLADLLVFAKVRGVFGERLQVALVGAAPIAAELLEFFAICGVTVLEGYGLSESCAAATLNTAAELRIGSVGRPLPGVELQIAADGEVLIRGANVFAGYHEDPDATRAAIDERGWLKSGDLGALTDDGYLIVTGRKKDLIITSSGKNVTPVNIENALRDTRWISEAVVYGDRRPYLVALLTLDSDERVRLAERVGVSADPVVMARDEGVHAALQRDVDAVNARLARIEQIKRFAILERDFSQDEGELTSTLKVKRAVVYRRYGELFDELYRAESGGA